MAATVASAAASAFASKAAGKLLGGGSASGAGGVAPAMFNAGGIGTYLDDRGILRVKPEKERIALIDQLKSSFLSQASSIRNDIQPQFDELFRRGLAGIDNLLPQVSPGFGRLTDARVNTIQNARDRSISNLSDTLARRRVSGSSFAQDQLASTELEFAQQEEEARAQAFLEELELTSRLEAERLQVATQQVETNYELLLNAYATERAADELELNEMNRMATVAQNLIAGTQQQLNRNADLAVDDVSARNNLAGQIVGGQVVDGKKVGGIDFDKFFEKYF